MESKEELSERIYKYFSEINEELVVYCWKYHIKNIDPDEVIGLAN